MCIFKTDEESSLGKRWVSVREITGVTFCYRYFCVEYVIKKYFVVFSN